MPEAKKKQKRGAHPLCHENSMESLATPEQRTMINKGRAEERARSSAMDNWYRSGFQCWNASDKVAGQQ